MTGYRGYLGGRLTAHLLARGQPLRLVSRAGGDAEAPGATRMVGNLLDANFARAACEGVANVIHLAAPNEIQSQADPLLAITGTISATATLVRAAAAAGVRRFIYLSTAHVYGSLLAGTVDERTPTRPTHPYAITHRAAEDFVLAAAARRELEVVVLRLSNAVGPPARPDVDRWTLLANDLGRQAVTTRQLRLRSSGLQWRDFIALSDICHAIEHLAAAPIEGLDDGLFNLGSGVGLRVIALAERIRDRCTAVLGFTPEISRPAAGPDEISQPLSYRIDKLRRAGFEPRCDLDGEIDATLRFCRDHFA